MAKGIETSVLVTSTTVVGVSAVTSATRHNSMLQSTLNQIVAGDYTLFLSDIVTLFGLAISAIGVALGLIRMMKDKPPKPKE